MDESHIVQELQQSLRNLEVRVGRLEEERAVNFSLGVTAEEPQKENAPRKRRNPRKRMNLRKRMNSGLHQEVPGWHQDA